MNGAKCTVMVDDYIPCKKDKYGKFSPSFSSANGNELWVIILEKIWAKVHGDYVKIIGGLSHQAFRDMTGAPSYMYDTRITKDLWKILF